MRSKDIELARINSDLDLKKIDSKTQIFKSSMGLLQHACTVGALVWVVHIIMTGVGQMVSANPEAIDAAARFVEKLQASAIVGHLVTIAATGAWWYERKGKKRAYRKLSDLRKEAESGDPYRASSELDDDGHTPS